jgi:hypothetical protein
VQTCWQSTQLGRDTFAVPDHLVFRGLLANFFSLFKL